MGKTLIIKGADFSQVAVEKSWVDVTPTIVAGLALNGSTNQVVENSEWVIYCIPMEDGMDYHIYEQWSETRFHRLGIATEIPEAGTTVEYIVNQTAVSEATYTMDETYHAVSDGYLVWQVRPASLVTCFSKKR